MRSPLPRFTDQEIVSLRPGRNVVDPSRPYAFLTEQECNADGDIVDVQTVFLTNRECPFHCLMCDLWKNTLLQAVPQGAIPQQIRWAIDRLPPGREIKLYNSGNFFDRQAIPEDDYAEIADIVRGYDTVIVENHPNLCHEECLRFRDLMAPAQLEIALGLESSNPEILALLNKKMTLEDFSRATAFLHQAGIRTRAFILLNPPFVRPEEGVRQAVESIRYAFNQGVDCCSVIATRSGNGFLDELQRQGDFKPPTGAALEQVLELGLKIGKGRVFVDLWDISSLFPCPACRQQRIQRLETMNLRQEVVPQLICPECGT